MWDMSLWTTQTIYIIINSDFPCETGHCGLPKSFILLLILIFHVIGNFTLRQVIVDYPNHLYYY